MFEKDMFEKEMFEKHSEETTLSVNQQIGAVLRDERINQGLSCDAIARDCKLQEVFVRAIEEGHTDYLPTQIYFRMFARLYADTLNIDPDQLLGKLYPELPLPEKPEFAGAAYNVNNNVQAANNQQSETKAETVIGGHVLSKPSGATYGQPNFDMSGLTTQSAQIAANKKRIIMRVGLGLAGVVALFFIAKNTIMTNGFATEDKNSTNQTSLESPANQAENTSTPSAYQPREQLELTIKAKTSAKNAVVVVIADGDTLFNRKMVGGESYTWNSNYRFKLNIADKDQVEIFIGGQRLQTPDGSGKSVSNFEITQLNYEEMLAAPLSSTNTAHTATK